MPNLRNSTLVFLVKRSEGNISHICLAMKKRGFGVNKYNGAGGKVEDDEEIEHAARREAAEEIGVLVRDMNKVGELAFYFPHNPAWDQLVHVYLAESWEGDPAESEEMKPQWFHVGEIPFDSMWPDDAFWLPEVIQENLVQACFTFGEGDVIQDKHVQIVRE